MKELTVQQTEWKRFFDDFSKRNQTRLVSVEILNEFGAQTEVKKMPFSGIVFETDKANSSFLEIMFGNRRRGENNHLTHFIPNVRDVFPKQAFDGCDEALEVIDAEGNKTLLTFEKLPELRAGAFYMTAGIGLW